MGTCFICKICFAISVPSQLFPKSILKDPIKTEDGYWITIYEDKSQIIDTRTSDEKKMFEYYYKKGFDLEVIEKMWTAALYHEVMNDIAKMHRVNIQNCIFSL